MTEPPNARVALAWAVVSLAARMEPKQASEAAQKALYALTLATQPPDLIPPQPPVRPWVPKQQAARVASEATQKALDALTNTTNEYALRSLAKAVESLAARMEPTGEAAQRALDAMTNTPDNNALRSLGRAVEVLLGRLPPEARIHRTSLLTLSLIPPSSAPLATLVPLAAAAQPLPGRFSEQELIDFLKRPCPQEAPQILVKRLGEQCGQSFANQWEFVEWARKHRPNLDLTTPPKRQSSP
jgi:hypothetical protein